MFRFSGSITAQERSTLDVKSLLIVTTLAPFRRRVVSDPPSKPTVEIRTAAPLSVQDSSDHPKKMSPLRLIRSNTVRFAPPRIEFVASKPTRFELPRSID